MNAVTFSALVAVSLFVLGFVLGKLVADPDTAPEPARGVGPSSLLSFVARPSAGDYRVTPLGKIRRRTALEMASSAANEVDFAGALEILTLASDVSPSEWPLLLEACSPGTFTSRLLVAVWSHADPGQAAAYLKENPLQNGAEESMVAFTRWAETDPLASLTLLQEGKGAAKASLARIRAERQILRQALERGQPEALEIAQRLGSMARRGGGGEERDPLRIGLTKRSEFEAFLTDPQTDFVVPVAKRFGELFPEAALDWMKSYRGPHRLGGDTFVAYYATHSQAALDYAERQQASRASFFQAAAAAHLARSDPGGALTWVEAHLRGRARVNATAAVLEEWGKSDPHGALEQLRVLSSGSLRGAVSGTVLSQWMQSDPEAARNYLMGMPIDNLPPRSAFYETWQRLDLDGAATYLQSVPSEVIVDGFASSVARGYADAGRWEDGLAWMRGLPPSRMLQAIPHLFDGIRPEDVPRAQEAIEGFAAVEVRREMQRVLSISVAPAPPNSGTQ